MTQKELVAFAKEAAKSIKAEKDLSDFSRRLKKVTVEAALGADLDDHLGYEKHQASVGSNSCNRHTNQTVYTDDGSIPTD
jgi:putative transposase